MYARIIKPPHDKSFFLFGPRGTGKTTWLKTEFPHAVYLDLLEAELFNNFLAAPERIENFIPPHFKDWVIVDEIQRVPALLNEVHRLIESKKYKFILTGSSVRKLRRQGTNLLAGRALTYHLYPLTALELKNDFSLSNALSYGHLPATFSEHDKKKYLESYVMTYLQQEIEQEGLTRQLSAFSRFLETASFSEGSVINLSELAREASIHRKVVSNYFSILNDLMIAYELPVFTKRAKRRLIRHAKFYFFDTGVYRTIRPRGPLDTPEEIEGVALETFILQEIRAVNEYFNFGYDLFFWRTAQQQEVDFVLYGPQGMKAIEIKRTAKISEKHVRNLQLFLQDYPQAEGYVLYGGKQFLWEGPIQIVPIEHFVTHLPKYLTKK